MQFRQTDALTELHLISHKIPIRPFLIHVNEHCLRQLKGWQVTVPDLPTVTSVSVVKTHSHMYALELKSKKQGKEILPVANADGGAIGSYSILM